MKIAAGRMMLVHVAMICFVVAILARAAEVQIGQHALWTAEALKHQTVELKLPALRGDIEDVNGAPLARSRSLVRLSIAKNEVKDMTRLRRLLRTAGVSAREVQRLANPKTKWVDLKGSFLTTEIADLLRTNGVHPTDVGDRVYAQSRGTRALVGTVGRNGGSTGLELQLDSVLRSTATTRIVRGAKQTRFESPDRLYSPPRGGHTVRLTINEGLQEICDQSLDDAVKKLRASGGDVVVLDPKTGAIRCLASRRPGASLRGATTLAEPFEPGSTLKPFLAAHLLQTKRATPDDVVSTENGRWAVDGRVITDTHRAASLSLSDVIRFSSNIGIAKFATRMERPELYQVLRDIGLGTPTGVPYGIEASGVLHHPREWTQQSLMSHAIGYEVTVTPLQLATAYAILANGGDLIAPALISEVRDWSGRVVYSHQPKVVRKVFTPAITKQVMAMLESVVDSGTARDAAMLTFDLAGKSGTARRYEKTGYKAGAYTATFVGLFPAEDPQWVVLSKIDNPATDAYYGGRVAAPLTRTIIQTALAAKDASLDWQELSPQRLALAPASRGPEHAPSTSTPVQAPTETPAIDANALLAREVVVDPIIKPPASFDLSQPLPAPATPRSRDSRVPDVRGLPLRTAVRTLHQAGYRVRVVGAGDGRGGVTSPPAGSVLRVGALVSVERP